MNSVVLQEKQNDKRLPETKPGTRSQTLRRWAAAACVVTAFLLGVSLFFDFIPGLTGAAKSNKAAAKKYVKKNIEDIRVGDVVMAWDETTGESAPKKVTRLYRRTSDHLRVLSIESGGSKQVLELKTTDEHPFFVKNLGWKKASELKPGQEVQQFDGQFGVITASHRNEHSAGVPVFNIETEGFHTYFVGENGARGPPVLVHNCNVPTNGMSPNNGNPPKLPISLPVVNPTLHPIIPYNQSQREALRLNGKGHGIEFNHLNQSAAYSGAIGPKTALTIPLQGQAAVNGTGHNAFHRSLETFWEPFRIAGTRPTNAQYDAALRQALASANLPPDVVTRAADMARAERLANGCLDNGFVPVVPPRVPGAR